MAGPRELRITRVHCIAVHAILTPVMAEPGLAEGSQVEEDKASVAHTWRVVDEDADALTLEFEAEVPGAQGSITGPESANTTQPTKLTTAEIATAIQKTAVAHQSLTQSIGPTVPGTRENEILDTGRGLP